MNIYHSCGGDCLTSTSWAKEDNMKAALSDNAIFFASFATGIKWRKIKERVECEIFTAISLQAILHTFPFAENPPPPAVREAVLLSRASAGCSV